jgi:hypothetical protein
MNKLFKICITLVFTFQLFQADEYFVEIQDSDEIQYQLEDQEENSQIITNKYLLTEINAQDYCKLTVNDMVIQLAKEENDFNFKNEVIKVNFQDDLLFECDFPKESLNSNFTWTINNQPQLDSIDSNLNIEISKNNKQLINNKNLFIICKVTTSEDKLIEIKFPNIFVENYTFKSQISKLDYFVNYKYKKLMSILEIIFLITLVITVVFITVSAITFVKYRRRMREKNHSYEIVSLT